MSNVRKHLSAACLAALVAPLVSGQMAVAEKTRSAAPIVFAEASGTVVTAASAVGSPMDIRPGAVAAAFNPVTTATSSFSPREALTSKGWSRPYAGPPYQVKGKWFVPMHEPDYDEVGIASWYGPGFDGELASSGEVFDQDALTAAHPTLPIPSVVRVTNLENNRSVLLRLNDRGPYIDDRIIDLSRGAADVLDVRRNGTAKVRVQYIGPAPSDQHAELDERMFASAPVAPTSQPRASADSVWAAELPAASGMPERPASQASAEAYDDPDFAPAPVAGPVRLGTARNGYALQVGSFSDLSNAHKVLSSFGDLGEGYVASAVVNGSQFYRVMLGPWPAKQDADRLRGQLSAKGKSALVVSLNP